MACSALKRIYRDRIRKQAGPVLFLFLDGHPELIRQRMQQRVGHYMQAGLLDSQLQTLEKPTPDECLGAVRGVDPRGRRRALD